MIGLSAVTQEEKVILAKEVETIIRAGEPAEFDNCTIEGDLNCSSLKIESPTHFNNTHFLNSVNFKSTIFNDTAYFMGAEFNIINCTETQFNKGAKFNYAQFNRFSSFNSSRFKEDAMFKNATFRGDAYFVEVAEAGGTYYFLIDGEREPLERVFDNVTFEGTFFSGVTVGAPILTSMNVTASDVLEKIKAGQPADFDNCTIEGDLNCSSLKIEGSARFNNTHFLNSVNFNLTTFNGTAYFIGSEFNGPTDFSVSRFNGLADFLGSRFYGSADFSFSEFNGIAGSPEFFNGDIYYDYCNFNDEAYIHSYFKKSAYIRNAVFNKKASFDGVWFDGDAYFWNTTFNDEADFRDSRFNLTSFFGSQFYGAAKFLGSEFSSAYFESVQFNKGANFVDAHFNNITSFNSSQFKGDALFENTIFRNKLSLSKTIYDRFFIRWHNIKGGLVYDDAAFMTLMKNFKDLGYFEDYDSCYVQYRKEHRAQPWPGVSDWKESIMKMIDYPLEWFYGYGKEPFNAFFISLGIVITFAFYWWAVGLGGPRDKTRECLKDGEEWLDGDLTDIMGFSVTVFLSGTKFFIDPPALPKIEGRSRSRIKKAFILERVLGALFSVLFFIAISGTIVRAA